MSKKSVHVVPHSGSWAVKTSGASKAAKVTSTQSEAINHATKMAKNNKSELIIHGRDGTIRSKDSYGNDPNPPKDREH